MVGRADSREIAKRAKELCVPRRRAELERDHLPEFAAMEPESATYFLGKSFSDAIRSARHAPPDRVTFTLRIGGVAGSGGFAEGPESSSVPQAWFSGPSTSLLTPPPQPMSASHSVQ